MSQHPRALLLLSMTDPLLVCPEPGLLLAQEAWLRREGLWAAALGFCLRTPDTLTPEAHRFFLEAAAWDLRCRAVLQSIGQAAQQRNLSILTFKGCALSLKHYAQVGQRSFGDIDLAVPRHELQALDELLRKLRFGSSPNSAAAGIAFDVHEHPLHQLAQSLKLSEGNWWDTTISLSAEYGALKILPPEQEFLLALFHGAKHAYSRANWIADLWVLAHRNDPTLLAECVVRHRAGRHLWLAQRCLQEWFTLEFPPELQQALRPPHPWDFFSHQLLRLILQRKAQDFLGMLTPIWAVQGVLPRLQYLARALAPASGQSALGRLKQLANMIKDALLRSRESI